MIFHVHFSASEHSGEIRRIRNINQNFVSNVSKEIIEISFLSLPLFFRKSSRGFRLSANVQKKIVIPTLPFRFKYVLFRQINSIWMSLWLKILFLLHKPSHIVVEYSIGWEVLRFVRNKTKCVIDAHGAVADEYKYNTSCFREDMYNYLYRLEIQGVREADYYICQSEAMKSYLCQISGKEHEDKMAVFQCNASSRCFRYDSRVRSEMRDVLGFSENEQVLVYSGGLHKWQMIDESIALFLKYKEYNPNCRMLILTRECEAARHKILDMCGAGREDISVLSTSYDQVYKYLNAADAGILLREDVMLNRVASPTKLGEYLMTGLPVISKSVANCWIKDDRFLFNIDDVEIDKLESFITNTNRDVVAEYGAYYHSLDCDINNISHLINGCK